ncbi:hypothetical protein DFJ73DRAFT_38102 [Zopfochytrium polystomum]|nr:hypothetical protein DFJ73DRAFT_38102 [Zopfochytrium polystomum]
MSSVGAPPPHWIGSGSDGSRGGEPPRSSSPSPYAQQMQYMPGQPGFPPYRPMPMPPPQMGGPPLSITRSSPNMSPSLQGAVMRPLPPPPPPHFMPGMPAPPPGMMMRPMPPPQMMPFMPPTLIRGQPPPRPHMMMGAPPPPPWMMGRPPLGPPPPGGFLPPATTTRRGSVGEGSVSNGHPFTSHSDIEDNHSAGSDPQAGDAPNHPDDDSSNKENVEVSLSGLSLKGSGDMRSSVTSMASSDGRPNSIGATPELTGLQSGSERNSVASFNSVGGGNPLPPPPPPPPGFQFPPGAMMMRPAPPPGTAFPAGPGAPPPPPPGFPIGASPYPAFPGMIRPMHPGPPPPTVARVNSFPTLAAPDFDAASAKVSGIRMERQPTGSP